MSLSRSRQLFGTTVPRTILRRRAATPHRLSNRFFISQPSRLSPRFFNSNKMSLDSLIFAPQTLRQLFLRRPYSSYNIPLSYRSTRFAIRIVTGLNTAVFALWGYAQLAQDRNLTQQLYQHTMLGWPNISAQRYYTIITSAFTHQGILHFAFNMIALNAFAGTLLVAGGVGIGAPAVFGLTLGSAVVGSAAFLYQRRPQIEQARRSWGRNVQSANWACGASGVVMGFGAAASCVMPFAPMYFNFIPVPIPMFVLMIGYMGYDYLYLSANDRIGHSAHLGGAAFGLLFYLTNLRKFGGVVDLLRRGARR